MLSRSGKFLILSAVEVKESYVTNNLTWAEYREWGTNILLEVW